MERSDELNARDNDLKIDKFPGEAREIHDRRETT
jgi:hypothetical protein